jgi:hypothetical protein
MINLIKLQPSLSIVLVAFYATEIQCLKQGLETKDFSCWEFKIAQLSKLLHTRVHKAKFMHLFNDT